MKTGKMASLALSGLILAGGFATASVAQQPPPPPGAMAPGGPEGRHGGMRKVDPAQRAAQRAERLRTVLQLRPEQEGALKTYLEAGKRPDGGRAKAGERRAEMATMTTPQRLDAQKARMAERQARFEQRATATKRFYAQLSPTQQKAFDALGQRGGGKGMRGHGGGQRGKGQRG